MLPYSFYKIDDVKSVVYYNRFHVFMYNLETKEFKISDEAHLADVSTNLFKIYNMLGYIDDHKNDVRNENLTIEYLENMGHDEIVFNDGVLYFCDYGRV
jgi:hypothetical protein